MIQLSIFAGDLVDAGTESLCTSTNPHLSLMMGTGAAVRARGGSKVLRACEAIVERERRRTGRDGLPPGSVHATTAGTLPQRLLLHCVASDTAHRSSPEIIKACVTNALAWAQTSGCRSLAMPVFASGHAGENFERATQIIVETLGKAGPPLEEVVLVINDVERAETAQAIAQRTTGREVPLIRSNVLEIETSSAWASWDE